VPQMTARERLQPQLVPVSITANAAVDAPA
jgi:hypothetical protein